MPVDRGRASVSDTSAAKAKSRTARKGEDQGNLVTRFVASLSLFVRQILEELRKVVRPTGSELLNYTIVVILFVMTIMAIVAGMDLVLHQVVLWVFAGG
jgi:preprotein translocase subunit SecE